MRFVMTNKVMSSEEFFGFQLGSDRKIARWDKIVEYFKKVEKQSDKIKVVDMGPTAMGNPFLLVIISSPDNLKNLEHLRQVNAKISDPRGLSEDEAKKLVSEGKAVICQSMSLHATEIGGTQMAPELAYDLLTRDDEETRHILDNVIFLMIPCFNPDGQIMVTDFYNKYLGTEYEGCNLPWLYNKYVGHDNNRDAFTMNMMESQYAVKVMYRDWHPQAYQDHHHMGSYGARLYVAPYSEPIHPYADPLIWRELSWYGAHMAYRLEEAGKTGILNAAQFLGWGHLGFHWLGNYHNIASMLTENASAKLATPMYIHPNQLVGDGSGPIRGFPHYKPQTNFPHPWPGGWWRLRDIVEQVKISAWTLLDIAARNKDIVLKNAYLKAKRQIERGKEGTPKAYVISSCQHDPLTAEKLIDKLLAQGIEIRRAKADFVVEGFAYPGGSYVIFLDQPKMGVIKTLLGRTIYPDDPWTREADGSPSRPQDMATDTLAEFMGVYADPLSCCPEVELEKVTEHKAPAGKVVGKSKLGYVFDCRLNDSFKAANTLIGKGLKITRVEDCVEAGGKVFAPGSFVAPASSEKALNEIARETGVDFYGLGKRAEGAKEVKPPRVAMYQRYWGGNIDEGWTRWLLEQFRFPYTTVMDKEIKEGNLKEKFDVLLLPNDDTPLITGEKLEEYFTKQRFPGYMPTFPPEYRSGVGAEGVEAIKKFVESGGTLVAMNAACDFAIEKLGLNVRNALKDLKPKEFFCPGSTLKLRVEMRHPMAYGMPENALSVFWNSPAFDVLPSEFNENYEIVAQYPEREIMQSGWLVGEEKIANKAAVVVAKHGKGKVVLMGIWSQHRGQTHGTFKLLFNNLL